MQQTYFPDYIQANTICKEEWVKGGYMKRKEWSERRQGGRPYNTKRHGSSKLSLKFFVVFLLGLYFLK